MPQDAWIQNAILKNNILFGKPFHEAKYKQVIKACALTSDLEALQAGDKTEIGGKVSHVFLCWSAKKNQSRQIAEFKPILV